MDGTHALPLAAIIIAAAGFVASHFRTKNYSQLVERVAKIETRVEVYFDLQEKYNAAILHRPTHKEVDELLEKREQLEPLPPEDSRRLDQELEDIVRDTTQGVGLRAAAAQMLAARKARRSECEQ
jgi:hypothetical protein